MTIKPLNDLINSETIKTIGGILFLAGITLKFYKFSLSGLLKHKIITKVRGGDILNLTGKKAKSFAILFLIAALSMTWLVVQLLLHHF